MTSITFIYQKILKPVIACLTVLILVITSIYLLGEMSSQPSFTLHPWVGYIWIIVTFFWLIYIAVWGLKGLRRKSK